MTFTVEQIEAEARELELSGKWPFASKCMLYFAAMKRREDECVPCGETPLLANPPADSGEAKDAARYRWLESMNGAKDGRVEVFIDGEAYSPGFLSGQIDAAIAAAEGEK